MPTGEARESKEGTAHEPWGQRDRPVRRVAHVVVGMPPGGKERVLMHLSTALVAHGIETTVICLTDKGTFGECLSADGIPVVALHSCRRWDLWAVWRLARLLCRFRPDVINVHDQTSLRYAFLANRLGVGRPMVLSCYGLLWSERHTPSWHERVALRDVAAVTSVCEPTAREYAQAMAWLGEVAITGNGVPSVVKAADSGRRLRAALGLSDERFIFLAVGGIIQEKGYEDLLAAASLLREVAGPTDWVVLVAGPQRDKDYGEMLARRLVELGLAETVRFLGYQEDVHALYSAANAFVLSSRQEGLPTVVLEAMAVGLPVVATDVGGVAEVLQRSGGGLLAEPANPASLAEKMGMLLRSDTLCADLGGRGADAVRQYYSAAAMAERYLGVYRRVTGAGG